MRYNKTGDYMKVSVGISLRHIHLTDEDYNLLFDEPIKAKSPLNQPGQFSAEQTVTLEKNGREFQNVRLIGPTRAYTQVEISRTDAYYLKIDPPVRESGHLEGAEEITIKTNKGQITRKAVIIADRHIHITKEDREKYNLLKDEYEIKVPGEKGGVLSHVHIKEAPNSYYELHLDSDDANAFHIKTNDELEIL